MVFYPGVTMSSPSDTSKVFNPRPVLSTQGSKLWDENNQADVSDNVPRTADGIMRNDAHTIS